jgi:hypothetical protein
MKGYTVSFRCLNCNKITDTPNTASCDLDKCGFKIGRFAISKHPPPTYDKKQGKLTKFGLAMTFISVFVAAGDPSSTAGRFAVITIILGVFLIFIGSLFDR